MQVGSYLGNTGRAANLVATAAFDPGCVKTKSDLVVMPSEGRILRFFALSATTSLKILGAVIPRRVFTQPGPKAASIGPPRNASANWGAPAARTRAREVVGVAESDPKLSSHFSQSHHPIYGMLGPSA